MTPRRTKAKDLRRKVETRPERRTIVVFCEGEASEPDYLNGLKRLPGVRANAAITVEIDPDHGVPLTLVDRAVERMESDDEVDECWCVFDVEALWLILHFAECTAYLTTDHAVSGSRKLDGRIGKRIDATAYLSKRAVAAQRAAALVKRHEANQTAFPDDNPSTTVHHLLAAIEPPAT